MAVIFIDGPDYSGKTTLAKAMGDYSDWSVIPVGQACREYFCSAQKTTQGTMELARKLWTEWFIIGKERNRDIHVDRSPLSTLVEQVIGDDPSQEDSFIRFIADLIEEHGMMTLYFCSVPVAVLEQREEENLRQRPKDARELKRTAQERSVLYHLGLERLRTGLAKYCTVTTDLVTSPLGGDLIKVTARKKVHSFTDYFDSCRIFIQGTTDFPNREHSVEITAKDQTVPVDWTNRAPFGYPDVTRGLNYAKEWLIHQHELAGSTVSRRNSLLTALFSGEPVNSNNVVVRTDADGYYSLIEGYMTIISKELSTHGALSMEMVEGTIGHHSSEPNRLHLNPALPVFIAALLLVYYQKETPPWDI